MTVILLWNKQINLFKQKQSWKFCKKSVFVVIYFLLFIERCLYTSVILYKVQEILSVYYLFRTHSFCVLLYTRTCCEKKLQGLLYLSHVLVHTGIIKLKKKGLEKCAKCQRHCLLYVYKKNIYQCDIPICNHSILWLTDVWFVFVYK